MVELRLLRSGNLLLDRPEQVALQEGYTPGYLEANADKQIGDWRSGTGAPLAVDEAGPGELSQHRIAAGWHCFGCTAEARSSSSGRLQ